MGRDHRSPPRGTLRGERKGRERVRLGGPHRKPTWKQEVSRVLWLSWLQIEFIFLCVCVRCHCIVVTLNTFPTLNESNVCSSKRAQVRGSPARAEPTKVCLNGASHTHSSQHFPGTFTLRGMGQSGLGRRMSMLHRGTQPTAPSRHVHWYLQLPWKDSPLL